MAFTDDERAHLQQIIEGSNNPSRLYKLSKNASAAKVIEALEADSSSLFSFVRGLDKSAPDRMLQVSAIEGHATSLAMVAKHIKRLTNKKG